MTLPPQSLDDNSKFIIAAAINLYVESRRRLDDRVLVTVQDVDPLLSICEALIEKRPWKGTMPAVRSEEPSEEEKEAIATATEVVAKGLERRA